MKMMLIPCINIMYTRICLKIFLITEIKFIKENIYWHATCRISKCL